MRAIFYTLLVGLATTSLANADTDPWHPSPFGAEDELGAVNYLSSAGVIAASKLVKEGKVYRLGMVTGPNTPAYGPRKFQIIVHQLGDGTGATMGSNEANGNDDTLITSIGIGSQIDGLGHIGRKHVFYNNHKAADVVASDGLKRMGTHNLPGIVTRGVVLDMTKHFGKTPVPAGTAYTQKDIEAAAKAQGVRLMKGDVVLFHSGYMTATAGDKNLTPGEPGLGVSGANYLGELGVVAVGGDSWALEAIPFENPTEAFPVHQILLAKYGVYILENMVTQALVDDGVGEFMFVLGVPRIEGSVQAIINPLAIR